VDRINFLRGRTDTSDTGRKEIRANLFKSLIEAGADRLRPIAMTTSTTVLGLLPMAFDRSESASLWSPLAVTVIGGMLSSTVLTLFLVPSFYLIFEDVRNIFRIRELISFISLKIYGIIKTKSAGIKGV
jgi:HAE1 family hydrophobic/amphiphilic exporter-1